MNLPGNAADAKKTRASMNKKFRKHIIWSTCVQVILAFLAMIATDTGESAVAFTYAAVAYWTGVLIIKKRRPNFETRTDHMYMRSGLIILSLLSLPVSAIIWSTCDK